jgi:hypothetical protein
MTRVYLICEGQTEETYVRGVLSPILDRNNIFITAQMIPSSKTQKGGALSETTTKIGENKCGLSPIFVPYFRFITGKLTHKK